MYQGGLSTAGKQHEPQALSTPSLRIGSPRCGLKDLQMAGASQLKRQVRVYPLHLAGDQVVDEPGEVLKDEVRVQFPPINIPQVLGILRGVVRSYVL